jgi:glycerol-3-phosphate acyltransferase PlsY
VIALAIVVCAYLVGSIPFSWIVARHYGVADVRKVGSGNVGATNVMRSAGRTAGGVAFLLDFLKGGVASLAVLRLTGSPATGALAAMAAVIGHMFPVWLGGKGGKGVATGAGAFLPLAPLAGVAALLSFPVTLALTRYVSVASMVGTLTLAVACVLFGYPRSVALAALASGTLVVWRHRANLRRLAAGTENRMGASKTTGSGG